MTLPRISLYLLATFFLATFMLGSCDRQTGKTVGFAQEGDENDWRTAETKSMADEASKRGVVYKFANAQGDLQKQINAVRNFVNQRASAIILAPKVETGWEPVLKEAKDAKVPVVLVDRGVQASPDLYVTLIASDFVEEGRRAAEWLAKHTVDDPDWKKAHADGILNVIELEGTAGAAPAIDRKKGFDDEIKKHENIHILYSQDGNFTLEDGKKVLTGALQQFGADKVNAVYAHNDDMALGAIQAIEQAGKKPGQDIMIVSIDGIHEALQKILDGKINCVVECNPLLGPPAFDAVDAALNGKSVPKKEIQKDDLFDKTNVTADLLKQRKY